MFLCSCCMNGAPGRWYEKILLTINPTGSWTRNTTRGSKRAIHHLQKPSFARPTNLFFPSLLLYPLYCTYSLCSYMIWGGLLLFFSFTLVFFPVSFPTFHLFSYDIFTYYEPLYTFISLSMMQISKIHWLLSAFSVVKKSPNISKKHKHTSSMFFPAFVCR